MAWIQSHQELRQHPKVRKAAKMLGISAPALIGHLHCLWWWALDYADDGDLSKYDALDIAHAAIWENDPESFIDALKTCGMKDGPGFLENVDGRLVIHDWWEYTGKLVERRNANRKRMVRTRAAHVQDTCADVQDTCANVQRTFANCAEPEKSREEKRRVEKSIKTSPKAPSTSSKPSQEKVLGTTGTTKKTRDPPDPRVTEVMQTMELKRTYKSNRYAQEAKAVKQMLQQGYTPDQIIRCYQDMKKDPFWTEKSLFMNSVAGHIGEWTVHQSRNGAEDDKLGRRTKGDKWIAQEREFEQRQRGPP